MVVGDTVLVAIGVDGQGHELVVEVGVFLEPGTGLVVFTEQAAVAKVNGIYIFAIFLLVDAQVIAAVVVPSGRGAADGAQVGGVVVEEGIVSVGGDVAVDVVGEMVVLIAGDAVEAVAAVGIR